MFMETNQDVVGGVNRQRGSAYLDSTYGILPCENYFNDPAHVTTNYYGQAIGSVIYDKYEPYGIGVWSYKPVLHVRSKYKTYPLSSSRVVPSCEGPGYLHGTAAYGRYYELIATDGRSGAPLLGLEHAPIPAGQKQSVNDRLSNRLPTLRPDVDLFVFIAELRDFAGLLDAACNIFRTAFKTGAVPLSTMLKMIREAVLPQGSTARDIARKASEHHLTWAFALRPFIKDVAKLAKQLGKWRDRIQMIKNGLGKVHDLQVGTSPFVVDVDDESVEQKWPEDCTIASCYNSTLKTECLQQLSASIKYRYTMPKRISDALDAVSLAVEAIGIMPNVESLWNLVPFSFVLDWFINTDQLLKRHAFISRDSNDVDVEVIDFCVSLKETRESALYGNWCHVQPDSMTDWYVEQKFYRWVGEEAFDKLSWWLKPPSWMAVLLGASLVNVRK